MVVVFDPAKNAENIKKHGYSLASAADVDFDTAIFIEDDSQNYGEQRWTVIGFLGLTVCVLVCVIISETSIRAISLREANKTERKTYAEET